MSESLQLQALQCAQILSARSRRALLDGLAGRAASLALRLRGYERYDDYRLERIAGTLILVTPSVFNPRLLRTGGFFAAQLQRRGAAAGADVLDMGTGSGVCALVVARQARRVVAVDINPAAVRCARLNAALNELEERVEVRCGDLFAPLGDERFDLVLFNPPFVRGTPRSDRERAWRGEDVAERFAAGLGAYLKPTGYALVLLSSFGDGASFVHELARQGFAVEPWARRRYLGEHVVIFKAARP